MTTAFVHSFETFGSVDGPGIRFVVFLQGCKMRCLYCHNPDTWKQNVGDEFTVEQILNRALRYRTYWGEDGGITCSGGEPLLQMDFMIEFFKALKAEGIHTTIDTAAGPFTREEPFFSKFKELMEYTDLVMLDLKHIDNEKHIALTHVPNTNILDCARFLDEIGKDVWIRNVLVPGYTDNDADLEKLHEFVATTALVLSSGMKWAFLISLRKWMPQALRAWITPKRSCTCSLLPSTKLPSTNSFSRPNRAIVR